MSRWEGGTRRLRVAHAPQIQRIGVCCEVLGVQGEAALGPRVEASVGENSVRHQHTRRRVE
jgi:hypothetical protein